MAQGDEHERRAAGRVIKVGRRDLLVAAGAGALAGGVGLALGFWRGRESERWEKRLLPREQLFAPSVFLAIDRSGDVTIWVTKSEMGQGVQTALPMLVAEELDADFARVRIEQAVSNRNYGNQMTGNSKSVRGLWDELRTAGASAREMLIAAAADSWGVEPASCAASDGHVVHAESGRRAGYGQLAELAAHRPVPDRVTLKDPSEFKLLGRSPPRLDVPQKVTGEARFGLDVRLPGMRFATVLRCPVLGGKAKPGAVERVRAAVAAGDGVREVLEISSGIAIVADTSWQAFAMRAKAEVEWEPGEAAQLDSAAVDRALRDALQQGSTAPAQEQGDPQALSRAASKVEAQYAAPYLAHATMEPINATAWVREGRCDVWAPTQSPSGARDIAIELTGLPEADVLVHTTLLGGGFGRRVVNIEVREAVELAKHVDGPVQVVWSREDDVQHDFYRPVSRHALRAGLDADGALVAWQHTIASPSMQLRDSRDELDKLMVFGAIELPYAIPNVHVSWASAELPVPLGFWRSVAHSYNAYVTECFLDEVAAAADRDPVELRAELLAHSPRDLAVLKLAAGSAGWGGVAPSGRARGVAVHGSFGSHVAMVAEVSIEHGKPRVHRVTAAVDCGLIVHPDTIEAQVEGGIAFGLTAALYGRIDLEAGRVKQSNFHDYPMLRIDEMPEIEVLIVRSSEAPGGVGEIAVPPIAPAVCNALRSLTGEPIRTLPIALG